MTYQEFENRLNHIWSSKYSTILEADSPHWTAIRGDGDAKVQFRQMLLRYALENRQAGSSRSAKNKAQQIFDEMGVNPEELEMIDMVAAELPVVGPEPQDHTVNRIMFIERKAIGLSGGEARIGRVTFSKSRSTIYYAGRSFRTLNGSGYKANYYCVETDEPYWISGCKRDGTDRLYGERVPISIDDNVREEYWTKIRNMPDCKMRKKT